MPVDRKDYGGVAGLGVRASTFSNGSVDAAKPEEEKR